jgi:ubiquinone/menaquinone biosynthesis C-methylase UbiE
MRYSCFLIFLVNSVIASGQDPWKNIYKESAWAERDQWQRAPVLISHLKIKEGSSVADIGCHEGYMTFKLSRVVGSSGKVYAVDVEQSKLDHLKANSDKRKTLNIHPVKGEYDDPKLLSNSLDAIIILDTYHEMDDHDKILQHVLKALKPGGRFVLCEPIAEERRKASRSTQEGKHELGMNFALEDLRKAGFKILKQQDPFADRSKEKGDRMWLIVAMKN